MWETLIEGGIRHQFWWRCSPKPGQNGPSTTATHIIIHGKSIYDSVVDEPQPKKNWKFLLVDLQGCFRTQFGVKPFTSRKVVCQLVRVAYIIWKVLLSFFYRFCSLFHIWRGSDLKNIWRFFMQTQGLSFNPSAIFHTLH